MVPLTTALVLVAALAVGLAVNSKVRPFATSEVKGVKLELLVSPLLTLTTLLLAFVLVQVFSSHNRAKLSAGDEAGRVAAEFRLLSYMDDESVQVGQSALICYARSVTEIEWHILKGEFIAAPEVFYWGDQLAKVIARLARERNSQPFGVLVATDRDRGEARRKRISETRPAVPPPVSWLMLVVSALAVFSIATFTLPYIARRVQIGALSLLTMVFGGLQIAILEIDSKFNGVIHVKPDEMQYVTALMERRLSMSHPDLVLPCNAQGEPLLPDES